ncbi:MAG: site-specific integrase [Deltaproteobacteria bacterium]|nr:site-specific integrase [Deltaproteobacteria bacterium]
MATRLRDRMIAEMEVRGLKEGTKSQYLDSMEKFVEFHKRPPVKLAVEDIKAYQLHLLKEKELAPNSINKELSGIRFFYRYVLGRHWYTDALPRVKTSRKMPAVLSEEEVASMIDSVHKVMWKAVIMTLYSSGIRHRELRNLKIQDIDSKRMCIHIRDGKGGKDRQALLSPITLKCLRTYWRLCRVHNPVKSDWLFMPTKNSHSGELKKKFSHTAIGYILRKAGQLAGIKKKSIRTYSVTRLPSI